MWMTDTQKGRCLYCTAQAIVGNNLFISMNINGDQCIFINFRLISPYMCSVYTVVKLNYYWKQCGVFGVNQCDYL